MKMKPEDTIDFNIRSTWHKIARMYNVQAAEHGVSMATGMVLLNIDLKEGTPSTSLGPKMGMESRSLTRTLKNLEDQKVIYRQADKHDKRKVRIFLTELGIDLGGKVHKTVNFTKKSDPEEGVREIAEECYKAVRRHAKKNPSIQDIKRSIVAAEWWLLMCQRHELDLEVNHEEALKTRRNLMRNP